MNTMQSAMQAMFKHAKGSMDTVELGELSCLTERASEEARRADLLPTARRMAQSGENPGNAPPKMKFAN